MTGGLQWRNLYNTQVGPGFSPDSYLIPQIRFIGLEQWYQIARAEARTHLIFALLSRWNQPLDTL